MAMPSKGAVQLITISMWLGKYQDNRNKKSLCLVDQFRSNAHLTNCYNMMPNVTTLTSVNKLEIVLLAVCHNTFSKPLDKGVLLEIYFLISQPRYVLDTQ